MLHSGMVISVVIGVGQGGTWHQCSKGGNQSQRNAEKPGHESNGRTNSN